MSVIESLTVNEFVDTDGTAHPFPRGNVTSFVATQAGTFTLLAAKPYARAVSIDVTVTTTFAAGTGVAPTYLIGYTGSTGAYTFTTPIATGTAGYPIVASYAGSLPAGKALILTATAATGTGAGAYTITSQAI